MNVTPLPQIALDGDADNLAAVNMTRINSTVYKYNWTVETGDGEMTPEVTVGVDLVGNEVTNDGSDIATYLWEMESGLVFGDIAGNITFSSTSSINTTFYASITGEYVIRLTVTDNVGNEAYDEFNLFVGDPLSEGFTFPEVGFFNGKIGEGILSKIRLESIVGWSDMSMSDFLNSTSLTHPRNLLSTDVDFVYVHNGTTWRTILNEEFDDFIPSDFIGNFNYFIFEFTELNLNKAIRHPTSALED